MKTKPFLRKIFFITLPSIIIFLFVLEIALRIGGYLYTQYRHLGVYSKARASNTGTFNILCLGDSFTVGVGTTSEHSYPRQLEKILQENISRDINVINGGHGSNTSSLLLKNIKEDINKYSPAIITVMIGCNNNWNLEDSSYFFLNRDNLSFQERLDRVLNGLRVYKLAKICQINFRHKIGMDKSNKEIINNKIIAPKSRELSILGRELFNQGEYSQGVEKLKEALIIDKNNYEAHLLLGMIWNVYKKSQLAKEEIWQAIYLVDEWDGHIVGSIICQIRQFDDVIVNRESELFKLKRYIQDKYKGEKRDKLGKIIDTSLYSLKNQDIYYKILKYDLREMMRIAKENGVRVILETYPLKMTHNIAIKKISEKYNIPLVDNEEVFEEKLKHHDAKDFFVDDGHCNENGYKLIAETTYDILVKKEMLPKNKTGEKNDR